MSATTTANSSTGASASGANVNSMTVTRALVELKTLDKRIQKLIQESVFCAVRGEIRKVSDPRVESAQSNYDRIRDLLERRVRLKSAIVLSNATTQVRICGREMSVAEAIEMKSSIANRKSLLTRLRQQFGDATVTAERENQRTRSVLENSLTARSSSAERDQLSVDEYCRQYMKVNGVEVYDPINVQSRIEENDRFITDFESEVDFVLSEKNAVTTISL